MFLQLILAFALVISFTGPAVWPLVEESSAVIGVVFGQLVGLLALAALINHRTIRLLDRLPARPGLAQAYYSLTTEIWRWAALACLAFNLICAEWPRVVRADWRLLDWTALDDVVVLLPYLLTIVAGWALLYPADRAIRWMVMESRLVSGAPVHPVWSFRQYMSFNFRYQMLIILLPMACILAAQDVADQNRPWFEEATGVWWSADLLVALAAGLIVFVAPLVLRYIWRTRPLPPDDLRRRLETVCRRVGFRYRDILIWYSGGMLVNAGVMGLMPRVRYVLLSDGLLESMDDRQIEAVFGHEAGHIRHHHLMLLLVFTAAVMLVVGAVYEAPRWGLLDASPAVVQMIAFGVLASAWGLGFGAISWQFEHQADLFAARCIQQDLADCQQPCLVHHPEMIPPDLMTPAGRSKPLCTTAAAMFGQALMRVAHLNGLDPRRPGWRHPSIASRRRFLQRLAEQPAAVARFDSRQRILRWALCIATLIGCLIAAWLYWPW
jgi:STE24 endopeptidase